MHIILLVLISF